MWNGLSAKWAAKRAAARISRVFRRVVLGQRVQIIDLTCSWQFGSQALDHAVIDLEFVGATGDDQELLRLSIEQMDGVLGLVVLVHEGSDVYGEPAVSDIWQVRCDKDKAAMVQWGIRETVKKMNAGWQGDE